jgi:predicted AAA+ superfamily ATPase
LQGYLEIVEDLLLGFRVPVFTRRARRELSVHPKLYSSTLACSGLFTHEARWTGPKRSRALRWRVWLASILRAWIAYGKQDLGLYYWRTRSGVEVDFIVYGDSGLWAIEVKNAGAVRRSDVRSLRAFREDYPECQPLLLYRGNDRLEIEGVRCWPADEFLRRLRPGQGPMPGSAA